MIVKNKLYWAYNLPLQVSTEDDGEEVIILNYMPRKEACEQVTLSEVIGEQTREEFFETAALVLENLAGLMRKAGKDPSMLVYYPDKGMD